MDDTNRKDGNEKLELKVRRVRTRIATNVKTGFNSPQGYTSGGGGVSGTSIYTSGGNPCGVILGTLRQTGTA